MSAPTPSPPEFSHMVDPRQLKAAPVMLDASEEQRRALARRFGIVSLDRLYAEVTLVGHGEEVQASGKLEADLVQSCAITGDDLPAKVREDLSFTFVPEVPRTVPDEEVELEEADLDRIEYSGPMFDLGEAVAESLALAIDPYATGPGAEAARSTYGLNDEGPKGPLAEALAKLVKKD